MTLRHAVYPLLSLAGIVALVAVGAAFERTTSVVSTTIQPHVTSELAAEDDALTAELEGMSRELRQRIEVKNRLVDELLAGRTTLAEVTTQFLAMNQTRKEYMVTVRMHYSGATDAEKTARNVIGFASTDIAGYCPIQRALVLVRLEYQLQQLTLNESQMLDHSH